MHKVEGLIDFGERQQVRDEIVDVYLAVHVPVDDLRDVGTAPRAAECGALPDAPGHELEGARLDLLAQARHADDDGDAPAAMAALEGLPHHFHAADALEAVVGAAAGKLDEVGDEIALHEFRVHEVRHAELAAERFARRIEIDADDHVGAHHARALHDVQANAAEAEHHDIGA